MSISKSDSLINLINSLTKAEKRHFKLYASRLESNDDVKFIDLFDALEQNPTLDEDILMDKLQLLNYQQFANIKRHLYSQLMISLRLIHAKKNKVLKLTKWIDYAEILKSKALYDDSQTFAVKAKKEKEKSNVIIESHIHHTSESIDPSESLNAQKDVDNITSNNQYLERQLCKAIERNHAYEFVLNKRESTLLNDTLPTNIKNFHSLSSQHSAILIYAIRAFHYFSQQVFLKAYLNAQRALYLDKQKHILDITIYSQLYSILMLTSYFYKSKKHAHLAFAKYCHRTQSETNFRYPHILNTTNKYLGRFQTMLDLLQYSDIQPSESSHSSKQINSLDQSEQLSNEMYWLYLKAYHKACIGMYNEALDIILLCTTEHKDKLTPITNSYFRILELLCHYRMNNFLFVENKLNTLRNYLYNTGTLNRKNEWLISFLRKGVRALNFGLKDDINDLISKLNKHKSHYEKYSWLYIDYISWLKSIRTDKTVLETIS